MQLVGPTSTFVSGLFCRKPVHAAGFYWAITFEGSVYRISLSANATPSVWLQLPSKVAGYSTVSVGNARVKGFPFQGDFLLTGDSSTIYAISLVSPEFREIRKTAGSEEFCFNSSVEESAKYLGVGAGADFYSFLVRSAPESAARLSVQYFDHERAPDLPFSIEGKRFIGPIVSGHMAAVCGEAEILVYDTETTIAKSFLLPEGFEPFFERPSRDVNIPPGHTPFHIRRVGQDWIAYVAGTLRSSVVILQADFNGMRYELHQLTPGSCISEVDDGLCISGTEGIRCFGASLPSGRVTNLDAGMPISITAEVFSYFRRSTLKDAHELTIRRRAGEPLNAAFADAACNQDTCFDIRLIDDRVFVNYLRLGASEDQRGLSFAQWRAE